MNTAVKVFGVNHQVELAIEECSEFTKAVNKLRRLGGIKNDKIIPPTKDSSIEYSLAYFDLCSEIADVKITIQHMVNIMGELGQEAVELSIIRKIDRLEDTIEKKIKNKNKSES